MNAHRIPEEFDYSLSMQALDWNWKSSPRLPAALIALLVLGLALTGILVPATAIAAHNILHHLNFLPLMMAGMIFGWRGAGKAALFALLVNAPLVIHHWTRWPLDAQDQIVELGIFSAAGLIAGVLSDRERSHRNNLEKTRQELERVYLDLRASIAQMKKAERLSAAGQLAASLAHEIRNPLASISGAAGILQRGTGSAEFVADSLEIIQKESRRLNALLTSFLNFARPRSLRLQPTAPDELIRSVLALAAHRAEARRIEFQYTSRAEGAELLCDPEQLKQVLLNLVINAIEASSENARIELTAETAGKSLTIRVEDQGSGISEAVAEHIFEPFFTTKATGSGLGLAISSMIVGQHGGVMSFEQNLGQGTTFQMVLPLSAETDHGV